MEEGIAAAEELNEQLTGELANDAEENVNGWTHKRLALDADGNEVKHGLKHRYRL